MNSRQRVIGALERTEIDRVPIHLACGGPNSAIDALLAHFGARDGTDRLDKMLPYRFEPLETCLALRAITQVGTNAFSQRSGSLAIEISRESSMIRTHFHLSP